MSMMPKSENGRKAAAMFIWGAITMSIGYGFMTLTTPTDEDIYARLSPELRRQFDREREKRRRDNDAALQQVFDQRNLDRPAWRTDVPDAMRQAKNGGEEKQKQRIPMSVDSEVPEHERHVSR